MALDLEALDAPAAVEGPGPGVPMRLLLDAIDEDAEQPRCEFDAAALQELAETIRARGVRQPVSVRPHPEQPGRWVLNFGARRLRASKLAGLAEIPAFVDASADRYDQVIENEQREGLKPLELALFVQRRLAAGESQAEIARRMGKSRQWVTLATALIDAPDWLLQAYREGRCRGLNELYELRRLHGEHGDAVQGWAAVQPAITRDRLAALRAQIETTSGSDRAGATTEASGVHGPAMRVDVRDAAEQREVRAPAPSAPRVQVEFEGRAYQLMVSVVPEQTGRMYVRPLTGGPQRLVPIGSLKLLGFVDG
jgi:ParB family chromosome partitioning protein